MKYCQFFKYAGVGKDYYYAIVSDAHFFMLGQQYLSGDVVGGIKTLHRLGGENLDDLSPVSSEELPDELRTLWSESEEYKQFLDADDTDNQVERGAHR